MKTARYMVTSSLEAMLANANFEQQVRAFEALDTLIQNFNLLREQTGAAYAMGLLRALLDRAIKDKNAELGAPEITCKKGCAFCCRINVDATKTEAQMVIAYARVNNIPIDVDALKEQANATNDERPFLKNAKCVFLGKDNLCKVYAVRPNACRKYFVVSAPQLCEATPERLLKNEIQISVSWQVEVIASAIINIEDSGNFSQQILNEL